MRRSELYVSGENKRACFLVARAEGPAMTADEVGDRLLTWAIEQKYPMLAEFQKSIRGLEEAAAKAIREGAK